MDAVEGVESGGGVSLVEADEADEAVETVESVAFAGRGTFSSCCWI